MNASQSRLARPLAALLLAAVAVGAFAQTADPERRKERVEEMKKRFDAADVNHDGLVSRDEAKAGLPFVHRNFDAIDTEKKGQLSLKEIAVFLRKQAEARKAGG